MSGPYPDHPVGLEAGQGADGGWDFSFAKWDPAVAWEWRGAVTVDASRTLRAYNRSLNPAENRSR